MEQRIDLISVDSRIREALLGSVKGLGWALVHCRYEEHGGDSQRLAHPDELEADSASYYFRALIAEGVAVETTTISTRRFALRPSAVSLLADGCCAQPNLQIFKVLDLVAQDIGQIVILNGWPFGPSKTEIDIVPREEPFWIKLFGYISVIRPSINSH
jgi:hypothetical protein